MEGQTSVCLVSYKTAEEKEERNEVKIMPDKFTIEMHQENMRKIIRPQPAGSMIEGLRKAAQKRRPQLVVKAQGTK